MSEKNPDAERSRPAPHPMNETNLGSLLYSGQFVLGPSFVENLSGWQRLSIGSALQITAHPALSLCHRSDGNRSLTLIGYIVDPDQVNATDLDVVDKLLGKYSSIQELINATFRFGGRWVLIAQDGNRRYLFNDPLGLRQAFYTDTVCTDNDLWVMSQTGMGAELLGLTMDPSSRDYMEWRMSQGHHEYMWPGTTSPFREILHLLPNHYLDINTGRCHRFWPRERLEQISLDEAIDRVADRMPRLLEAAVNRFDLALGLTAGLDSRLVLAASKAISERISYISVQNVMMHAEHADLTVPANILQKLGLRHDVIVARSAMSPAFRQVYEKSIMAAHAHYGPNAEAILGHYGRTKAAVTGSGSEICREELRLGLPLLERRPSPEFLAMRHLGGLHPFTMQSLRGWCERVPHNHGIHPLDLFEWEQGCGNWLAMTQLEFSIAWREIFTPFNCRTVLTTLLAIPARYRMAPDYTIYNALIGRLWPEVMTEPINPHKEQSQGNRYWRAMKFLTKYGVSRALYRLRGARHARHNAQ